MINGYVVKQRNESESTGVLGVLVHKSDAIRLSKALSEIYPGLHFPVTEVAFESPTWCNLLDEARTAVPIKEE